MNFTDYAEKAINRYGLTGYNNLAREIGIKKSSMSALRAGKTCPTEENMIRLAELAGMPKEEALIDLNLWRSKDKPEVQKIWQRLSKMIGCLLMVFGFSILAKSAQCQELTPEFANTFQSINQHYATNLFEVNASPLCYFMLIQRVVNFVNG